MAPVDRLTGAAGAATAVMGVTLTAVPGRAGPFLGLGDRPELVRSLGIADLALAPVLLRRRDWSAMTARAGLNAVVAIAYHQQVLRAPGDRRARAGRAAMAALTLVDGWAAVALRHRSFR